MQTNKRLNTIIGFLFISLLLSGCTAIKKSMEKSLGNLSYTNQFSIGTPDKRVFVVKTVLSDQFSITDSFYVIPLGDEFTEISIAKEFSEGGADYTILEGKIPNQPSKYLLVSMVINRRGQSTARIFNLPDTNNNPLIIDISQRYTRILQEIDRGYRFNVWYVKSPSNITGPELAIIKNPIKSTKVIVNDTKPVYLDIPPQMDKQNSKVDIQPVKTKQSDKTKPLTISITE